MNFDYVRLLSVEISLLMMNLSYRMPMIICFLLFAYESLDSSSVQIKNKMQCANRTHEVQVVYQCSTYSVELSLHIRNETVNAPKFDKKEYIRAKTQKEKNATCICSAEIYERAVHKHNQCSTGYVY